MGALGLGDHPTPACPVAPGGPHEVAEHAGRRLGLVGEAGGLGQGAGDPGLQAGVARKAKDVIDLVRLAPAHQRVTGEAAVGAQDDLHLGPALADQAGDARHLFNRAGGGVDVGLPQLGAEQVLPAEDVERQVAVAIIVAVEEAAFLVAVDRIVGGVQVQDDRLGRLAPTIQEKLYEKVLDGLGVVTDLAVAVLAGRRMLKPVQRALA